MENKIKILSVYWWLIDFDDFGEFTYFLIDFRDCLSTEFNMVLFTLNYFITLKGSDFVKKGLDAFLNSDREIAFISFSKDKKDDLKDYYDTNQSIIKLRGKSEIELTLELETKLREKLFNYILNRELSKEANPFRILEIIQKMFVIS